MDYRLYTVYIRIINNMKKVFIVIYYYINFFWWPKISGGAFDMMSPPVLKVGGTYTPHPPICDAPRGGGG